MKTQYQRALTFFDSRKAQFSIVQCEKALHSNTLLLFVRKLQRVSRLNQYVGSNTVPVLFR